MPSPSTTAAATTSAPTAMATLTAPGSFLDRMLSGVMTTPGLSLSRRLMPCPPSACLPGPPLASSCRTVPELAAAVDDRPRCHVDHQRDAEQDQAGGDQRAAAGGVGLAEG